MQPQPSEEAPRFSWLPPLTRRHWLAITVMSLLLAFGSYGLVSFYYWQPFSPDGGTTPPTLLDPWQGLIASSERRAEENQVNILVLGTDEDDSRSDALFVASVNTTNRTVRLLSIPRDSKVPIYGLNRWEKIGHASAYDGPELSGYRRAMHTVADFLEIPIHKYVSINLDLFVAIVDELGGIYVDVPMDMHYDDPFQNLHIHLNKGYQQLNGEQVMQLVRFRNNNDYTRGYEDADLGRIRTQQQVFKAILAQARQPGIITRVPSLIDDLIEKVRTDLTKMELMGLVQIGLKISPDDLEWQTIPGQLGGGADFGYFLPAWEQLEDSVNWLTGEEEE